MTRDKILQDIRKFFTIDELVCDHTYERWHDKAWQFLDTDYLHALLVIRRDILQVPMTCNHDDAHQRGLRCNMCDLVKSKTRNYLSSHILGKAGDFTPKGMTAEQARQRIIANAHQLPCSIRLEDGVSWLHFDVLPQYDIKAQVYVFKE